MTKYFGILILATACTMLWGSPLIVAAMAVAHGPFAGERGRPGRMPVHEVAPLNITAGSSPSGGSPVECGSATASPPAHEHPALPAYREVRMSVSAYCPCQKCCGPKACGITASGKPVSYNGGRFCAAPKSIPFGTMIDIPGYGCVSVTDRGGAITEGRLDVCFQDHKTALAWGRQTLVVKVYRKER